MPSVATLNNSTARGRSAALWAAYAGTVVLFLWVCSHFYLQGKAFTYLVEFGAREEPRYIPELRSARHYVLPDSYGYDGQYYAQIAMKPGLGDPALRDAVDNLPYRARRILFCWTAWAIGGGDPVRALHVFAVQNMAAWLLLAALLLRWFPPVNWGNWLRWAGVLGSVGMAVSVRSSLMDGPSLLLIAAAVALLEARRPWLAAALLGVSGLGRETNLMAGAALGGVDAPGRGGRLRLAARWALVILPLAAWLVFLSRRLGEGEQVAGARNFALPLAGYAHAWAQVIRQGSSVPWRLTWGGVAVMTALTIQALFLALRPRWHEPWWRVGAAYAARMLVLGDAVWEGYPGAACRVLLPMILAFNILVPRGRRWWLLLLLGNISAAASPAVLAPPFRDSFTCDAPAGLSGPRDAAPFVDVSFGRGWYGPERSWLEYWRWSSGDAAIELVNPHPFAVTADISFGLRSADARSVAVRFRNGTLWLGPLRPGVLRTVTVRGVRLEPGTTEWNLETDRAPAAPANDDTRRLAFSLRNLRISVLGRAGP